MRYCNAPAPPIPLPRGLPLVAILALFLLVTSCGLLGPDRAVTVELYVLTGGGTPATGALTVVHDVADRTEVGAWLGGQNCIGPGDGAKRISAEGRAIFHDISKGKVFVLVDAPGHLQYAEVFRMKQGYGTYIKLVQLTPLPPGE